MSPHLWQEYAAPLLGQGIVARLDKDMPQGSVLVLNPHQGLALDEADRRVLLALSGMRSLLVVRVEPTESRYQERAVEVHFSALLSEEYEADFMTRLSVGPAQHDAQPPEVAELTELLKRSAGLGTNCKEVLSDREVFQKESIQCLDLLTEKLYGDAPETSDKLYYLLMHVAQLQAGIFHRLSARLGDTSVEVQELGRAVRTVRLVESACALRNALRVRWGTPPNEGISNSHNVPALLFVDDNIPFDLRNILRLAAKVLWGGAKLRLWNPLRTSFGLREIIRLGAVGTMVSLHQWEIQIEDFTGESSPGVNPPLLQKRKLGEVLSESTHLVVDQFFDGKGEAKGLRGPEIIRFLGRVLPAGLRDGRPYRPRIVAFSRNQEPDMVIAALRGGADGYVLKSAPASLTSFILGGIPAHDPTTAMSRNFEGLSHVPPRIRDLTKTIEIPKISPAEWYQAFGEMEEVARLLQAIPKAELHIHVGSCMSREFLITASIIGLASLKSVWKIIPTLDKFFAAATDTAQNISLQCRGLPGIKSQTFQFGGGLEWISTFARQVRSMITKETCSGSEEQRELRSFLRSELQIPDWISWHDALRQLEETSSLAIVLSVLRAAEIWSSEINEGSLALDSLRPKEAEELFVRTYLVTLAKKCGVRIEIQGQPLTLDGKKINEQLEFIHGLFFSPAGALSVSSYRDAGWRTPDAEKNREALSCLKVTLDWDVRKRCDKEHDPIGYTLATGLQSPNNLIEYLEGCEFSGSLHLKHPYLIHLYAEQVLTDMVQEGTVYRELRGSPDGYVNPGIGFSFGDACSCLVKAFAEGQDKCVAVIASEEKGARVLWQPEEVFGEHWALRNLSKAFQAVSPLDRRLPPKVGILLVGKRHKSNREMILEAAAGAVMYQENLRDPAEAENPVLETLRQSGIVGFDLAGQESDYPPALFATEFERLGKLHIPLTVHAGENASSQFVEDAILLLGAKRIGHALSLSDDRHLMNRLREDRICVELCPVSNHQTCHFSEPEKPFGRKYPLEAYIEAGIPVCLNTDNPIISGTDLINEFFVAASTMNRQPLTLWLALLLVKTAFRSCFLPLAQRRILIRTVDNYIENLLQDPSVVELMERLVAQQKTRQRLETRAE